MSNLDSWEDETQEETLAKKARNLNLAARPNPATSSFTPSFGAQSFVPQQNYPQQAYPQYNQSPQPHYPYNSTPQQYPQYGHQNLPQQPQQQRQQPSFQPTNIAGRPPPSQAPVEPAVRSEKPLKSVSIGGPTPAPIAASTSNEPKVKVLTLGATKPVSDKPSLNGVEAKAQGTGSKATAAQAISKSDKPSTAAASASGKSSPRTQSGRASPTNEKPVNKDVDAVVKAQAADVSDEVLTELYGKEHLNIIFIGHVDAGKSSLAGSILVATGMVDDRTLEKYKRDAKEAGRESWYLAWCVDLTKEERAKGKTQEAGRGFFETEKKRYSIIDAPGHKLYVRHMIGGASQADVGILVISARKGEYETGFEKEGQTREHITLAKTQGVNKIVVVVTKMDDPTVEWSQERFEECTTKLKTFLKSNGYNPERDLVFMPISAITGEGIQERISTKLAPWYNGPCLLEYLDSMPRVERKVDGDFMMPISAKYRDMGTMVEGRIESGLVKKGDSLLLMPSKTNVEIGALYGETEDEIDRAICGEQVRARLKGVEEEDLLPGYVLCSPKRPVHCVSAFNAELRILDLRQLLSAGANCVLHVHSSEEEVTFAKLLAEFQKGAREGRRWKRNPTHAKKGGTYRVRLEVLGVPGRVCVERYEDYPQLGRFTLRDQGQTIAIGKIIELIADTAVTE